jgi:hypothetical protein
MGGHNLVHRPAGLELLADGPREPIALGIRELAPLQDHHLAELVLLGHPKLVRVVAVVAAQLLLRQLVVDGHLHLSGDDLAHAHLAAPLLLELVVIEAALLHRGPQGLAVGDSHLLLHLVEHRGELVVADPDVELVRP